MAWQNQFYNWYEFRFPFTPAVMWSYASHGAQYDVSTSQSIFCGFCVRDNHFSFRLFALSNPSVPTLCLKDLRRRVDKILPDLPQTVRYYEWLHCLATQTIEKTRCLTTKKSFLLKHVCVTINNKQTRFAFRAKR